MERNEDLRDRRGDVGTVSEAGSSMALLLVQEMSIWRSCAILKRSHFGLLLGIISFNFLRTLPPALLLLLLLLLVPATLGVPAPAVRSCATLNFSFSSFSSSYNRKVLRNQNMTATEYVTRRQVTTDAKPVNNCTVFPLIAARELCW